MESLKTYQVPELRDPIMIAAFIGWPDAGEVASSGLRYLIRKKSAIRFAEIDPEEYYDFYRLRPKTVIVEAEHRLLEWPSNEFFYVAEQPPSHSLVLFLATEPHLRWRSYVNTVLGLAKKCGIKSVMTLGGTYDMVPHTGDPQVSGSATDPLVKAHLGDLGVHFSGYQGPTSIHSALMDAFSREGIPSGSLWGHAPHYIQAVPNLKVSYAILRKLTAVLGMELDLEELRSAGALLEERVNRALADNPELQNYVRQLEERHEVTPPSPTDTLERGASPSLESLNPEAIVKDLEDFFREQRRRGSDQGPSDS